MDRRAINLPKVGGGVTVIQETRYSIKMKAGMSPVRSDGSVASQYNDTQSTEAERFAANYMNCKFNDSVTLHGDGGKDFTYSLDVEVIWLGVNKFGKPRTNGYLIVNPYEKHRWADIYVVVSGDTENGFRIVGWTTHNKLITYKLKNFGYGPKMAMPISDLYEIDILSSMKRKK